MIYQIAVLLLLASAKGEDTIMEFEKSPLVYEGDDVLTNIDFSDIVESKQMKRGIGGKTDLGMRTKFKKFSSPAFHFSDDFKGIQKDFYNIMPYGDFSVFPYISVFGQKGQISFPKFEVTDGALTSPFDPYRPYFNRFSSYLGEGRPTETVSGLSFDPLKTDIKKAHIKSVKIKTPKHHGNFETTIYGFNKGHSKKVFPIPFNSYAPTFTGFSVYPKDKYHFLQERFKTGIHFFTPNYLEKLKPAIPVPGKLGLKKVSELPIVETIPGVPVPALPILSEFYKPPVKTDIKLAHLKAVKLHQPVHPTVLTDLKKFKKLKKGHSMYRAAVVEGLLPSSVNTVEGVINAPIAVNFKHDLTDIYKSLDYDGNAIGHHYITTGYESKNEALDKVFHQLIKEELL